MVSLFFVVVPVVTTAAFVAISFHSANLTAVDFHNEYWPAAHRLLAGLNPYDRGWQNFATGVAFPYPAFTAVAFTPFALLPRGLADAGFTAISLVALVATLRLLRVRDWRVYGLVLLWPPVIQAWQSANLTLMLGLGIACLWRERDRPFVAGVLVAVLISLKPFVWPLALWLLATRRWRAFGYTAVAAAALNLIAWAVVGFDQLEPYRRVVQGVTAIISHRGYSVVTLAFHLGATRALAYLVAAAACFGLALGCLKTGSRRNDRAALVLSIGLALAASPIVWSHYFALLLIPLALVRPRLGVLWFLPLWFWVSRSPTPPTADILMAFAVTAVVVAAGVRGSVAIRRSDRPVVLAAAPKTQDARN